MRVTLKDISQKVNVSVSTVSDILNGRPVSYSEDLRKQVFEAVKTLNYRPNALARGLRRRQTELLGLVIPNRRYSFFADIAIGIEKYLRQRGSQAITVFTDDEVTPEGSMVKELEVLHARQVDGIILNPCQKNNYAIDLFKRFIKQGTPIVLIDQDIEGIDVPFVGTDDVWSSREAVRYLIGKGHRRIAHMSAAQGSISGARRLEGYKQALEEAGILFDPRLVFEQRYDVMGEIQNAVHQMLDMPELPTAVFCASDLFAGELYNGCYEKGLKIPQDLSVMGFGNLMISEYMVPKLTTMDQNPDELARQIVTTMFEQIEAFAEGQRSEKPVKTYVKAKLTERGSVCLRSNS
jgi:LacI family transcriptional regulator